MKSRAQPESTAPPGGVDPGAIAQPDAWDRVASGYADFVVEHLGRYAAEAITLADIEPGEAVLDVATGPGTLARQAAHITRVHALDFSARMLEELRQRAEPAERDNLVLQQGDGQALPYDDGSFDAAFSMFGLFMFPDRAKGFAELRRVLRPGGRAVVASWQPQDEIDAFSAINAELAKEFTVPSAGVQPLAEREEFIAEMSAAGFEVEIHEVSHAWTSPSLDAFWDGMARAHVLLALAAEQLSPDRYEAMMTRARARLEQEQGTGPQSVTMGAWLALGRFPAP